MFGNPNYLTIFVLINKSLIIKNKKLCGVD